MKSALRIVMVCSFLSLGMGSCSASLEEVCNEQIPQLRQELTDMKSELSLEIAKKDVDSSVRQNRAIASVQPSQAPQPPKTPHRYFNLDEDEKEKWQDWSAKNLKLAERYLTFARSRTEMEGARKPLSTLAERLVDFNGYADLGLLYQMRESLGQAQEEIESAARSGCAATHPETAASR